MLRLLFDFSRSSHRKRLLFFLISLAVFAITGFLGEHYYLNSVLKNGESPNAEQELSLTEHIQSSFNRFQSELYEVAHLVKNDTTIHSAFPNGFTSPQVSFERLAKLPVAGYSIELFDNSKELRSWCGNEGIHTEPSWLNGKETSFGIQGPVYSYLIVVIPVEEGTSPEGYIVAKRLFDVKYPISNRFINEDVFTSTFTNKNRIEGTVEFGKENLKKSGNGNFNIPLQNINGELVGIARVQSPSLQEGLEESQFIFEQVKSVSMLGLLVIVLLAIGSFRQIKQSQGYLLLWFIISLWTVRFLMLNLDLPGSFISSEIFEASSFASIFGFGVAKSIGELLITAICLFVTILVTIKFLTQRLRENSKSTKYSAFVFMGIFSLLLPLLLRGDAAIIHSAVFDSTLGYNDRMYILPPFELGSMFAALFIITLALVIAGVFGIFILQQRIISAFEKKIHPGAALMLVLCILIFGSLLVGILHPNPLFSQIERIAYIAGFGLCSLFIKRDEQKQKFFIVRIAAGIVLTSIIAVVYPLDNKIHDFDRSHAEFVASNVFRPADSYFTLVTQQALRELSSNQLLYELSEQQPTTQKKLAFKAWAQSVLSREGYNCYVSYINQSGENVSTFYLGASWETNALRRDIMTEPKEVTIEDRVVESRVMRIYRGYMPFFDSTSSFLGGVTVEVSAGKQSLLGGETPEFLRNYPEGELATRYRTLIYSEYTNGKLSYSSSPAFHSGVELPPEIIAHQGDVGLWTYQDIDTVSYESFFFPVHHNGQKYWYALSMRELSFNWHMYNILRIALFLTLFSLAITVALIIFQIVRGKNIPVSFRAKLIGAFFIVSLIPTGILAYYNRQFAIDRLQQSVIEQVEGEATTISTALQRQWTLNTPFDVENFTDIDASHASSDFNIPFTLFHDAFESASSTPELFRAELFDRRMSSDAFLNVVLYQKRFYSNIQSIGALNYIVGYHPIVNDAGKVIAVVAVPTLFRLREFDREIVRRNVYLFGTFVFAMLIALLVGLFFSQQISFPIRRLYLATRKIGAGDFNINLQSTRNDELGELERSFNTMLTELKRSEEEKIKVERELAWKEMAKQVAHEIKNPLTPMKLSIQHLRQAYSDRVEGFEQLLNQVSTTILEQIETLSRIASEFAHFARMPERKLVHCELHLLLRDVIDLFSQYKDVTFNLQFCSFSPIILGDKEELRRAFMNIVRNAIQAMNDKGNIIVHTEKGDLTTTVTFTDTGMGIAQEFRDRLFEPNFSTKTDGMGMGLAIVKKTIDDLNGTISIESIPEQGTSVRIVLPLVLES